MKNFDYKGRDATGRLVSGTCEAEDRATVLRRLKAQGLVPVSVSADMHTAKLFKKPFSLAKYALLAGCVLLIGVIGWLTILSTRGKTSATPPVPATEQAPREISGAATMIPTTSETVEPDVSVASDPGKPRQLSDTHSSAAPTADKVPPAKLPAGLSRQTVFTVPRNTNATVRVFDRSIETYMSQFVIPGRPMPPPPPGAITNLEEQVREALTGTITVDDDEPEQTYQIKAAVAAMKEELREVLKNGGSAYEYFENLHERQMSEEDLYKEARGSVVGLIRDGKVEEAKKTINELNAYMKAQGLPPVTVPPPYRKALGIQ